MPGKLGAQGRPRAIQNAEPSSLLDRYGALADAGLFELFGELAAQVENYDRGPVQAHDGMPESVSSEADSGGNEESATLPCDGSGELLDEEEYPTTWVTRSLRDDPGGDEASPDDFDSIRTLETHASADFDGLDDGQIADLIGDRRDEERFLLDDVDDIRFGDDAWFNPTPISLSEEDLLAQLHRRPSLPTAPSRLDVPTDESHARRLARQFLMEAEELSPANIDLIAEIIQTNGWSSTQLQVKHLLARGLSVTNVHIAWQLRVLWRESHFLHASNDTIRVVNRMNSEVLTWAQAVLLIEHFYWLDDADEIIAALEMLQTHWLSHPELSTRYPVFKDYLFSYRISKVDRKHDLGLQVNLEPHDERSFDGFDNGCDRLWWHGDIDDWEGRIASGSLDAFRLARDLTGWE